MDTGLWSSECQAGLAGPKTDRAGQAGTVTINNNIITSKNIVINIKKQKTNIRSCDVTISLKIRFKTFHVQQRFIHAKKIVVLLSRVQLTIVVHDFFNKLLVNCDFFFELNDIEFTLYAHFVDSFIKIILVTNNIN